VGFLVFPGLPGEVQRKFGKGKGEKKGRKAERRQRGKQISKQISRTGNRQQTTDNRQRKTRGPENKGTRGPEKGRQEKGARRDFPGKKDSKIFPGKHGSVHFCACNRDRNPFFRESGTGSCP